MRVSVQFVQCAIERLNECIALIYDVVSSDIRLYELFCTLTGLIVCCRLIISR